MIRQGIFGLIAALLLLVLAGCAKQVFQTAEAKPGKSVIYLYWPEGGGETDRTFEILLNGRAAGTLHKSCYLTLRVPEGPVALTVRNSDPLRAAVEKRVLHFDGRAGEPHYVKVTAPFEVVEPDAATAAEEIKETTVWEDFDFSFNFAGEDKELPEAPKPSVSEEIERLHALKAKGAITEEEYELLKARVISGE